MGERPLGDRCQALASSTPSGRPTTGAAELGTAGYLWIDEVASGDGVVEISRQRAATATGDGPVAGRSTAELLLVRALIPGHAHIELSQRRPWETGVPPRAKLQVNVEVIDPGR